MSTALSAKLSFKLRHSPRRRVSGAFAALLLALLLSASMASAQASTAFQFNRGHADGSVHLHYSFEDIEGQRQQWQLTFLQQDMLRQPVMFRPLSPARLQRALLQQQREFARQQGWRGAQVELDNGRLIYQLHNRIGAPENALPTWRAREAEARAEILRQHYYQSLRLHTGNTGYTPDHPRVAAESVSLLSPLIAQLDHSLSATYDDYTPRQALAYVSHFIQQIPYAELTDRLQSNGAGFVTPGRLLHDNRGDCDSKVTLLAALMAGLFADVERRIVYLPGHAMFALALDPEPDDIFLRDRVADADNDERATFVIADPTGPAQLNVGEAARAYQSHLRSGAVTLKPI